MSLREFVIESLIAGVRDGVESGGFEFREGANVGTIGDSRQYWRRRDSTMIDFFQGRQYRVNKWLLFYLGQWPLQTPRERLFFRSTTIILVGSILVPKIVRFVECLGDINGMIQCLPVLGLHVLSVAKFSNYVFKAEQMRQLTYRIQEDRIDAADTYHDTILSRYAERARLLTITYGSYLFATLWTYLLMPAVPILMDVFAPQNASRERITLYETQYFVNPDKYYYWIIIHAYITMPLSVGMIIAFDTMFAVYIHHACGIFSSLGARLTSLGRTDNARLETSKDPSRRNDEAYNDIVACVKMHKQALEFATLLESSCTVCFFFVIGTCILMVTLTGYMTVTNLDEPGESIRFGAFALGEVIHLYYLCWQGQELMDHSEHIFQDAYNVDWYDISTSSKRLLILIMLQSSRPCKITAGKIYVLSLENFTTALKTSMSYFTVMLSMQ